MTRGMWRWVDETSGRDRWYAHVEVRPGEWADLTQDKYERDDCQPSFWDLPLREDYMALLSRDPIAEGYNAIDRKVMEPAIILLMITLGVAFIAVILLAIIGVRLGF